MACSWPASIHDIAPQAEIHVFPVLNEFGVGDAFGLVRTPQRVARAAAAWQPQSASDRQSQLRGPPFPFRLGGTGSAGCPASRELAGPSATHAPTPKRRACSGRAHSSLARTIHWLRQQGVLVVAAAGNDALRPQTRDDAPPPPRFPPATKTSSPSRRRPRAARPPAIRIAPTFSHSATASRPSAVMSRTRRTKTYPDLQPTRAQAARMPWWACMPARRSGRRAQHHGLGALGGHLVRRTDRHRGRGHGCGPSRADSTRTI